MPNIFSAIFTILVYCLLGVLAYYGVLLIGQVFTSILGVAFPVIIAKIVAALVILYGVALAFNFTDRGWRVN